MGPGTRWMDYRCDSSTTLKQLQESLKILTASAASSLDSKVLQEIESLRRKLDGSLSIRLLLESIPALDGELQHHLLSENYLSKRDGMHGDWLARLDPEEPAKTIVSHMGKDTYAYIHPYSSRMLSVREAARIQTFPDWFSFGNLSLVDAFRNIGNAVPPLLSYQLAGRVAKLISYHHAQTMKDKRLSAIA